MSSSGKPTDPLYALMNKTHLADFDAMNRAKQDNIERLQYVTKERIRIRSMITEWPNYVSLYFQLRQTGKDDIIEFYGIPDLTIGNITEKETEIVIRASKAASDVNFNIKDLPKLDRIKSKLIEYIRLNKQYQNNPVCSTLKSKHEENQICYREFAMNEWLKFYDKNRTVPPTEIIEILSKPIPNSEPMKDREPTRPLERMLDNVDNDAGAMLNQKWLGGGGGGGGLLGGRHSISSRKSAAKRRPHRKSTATKRRPHRKSSAIKRRPRRTSRK